MNSASPERFDEAYFQRYYRDPRTRVGSPDSVAKLARAVVSLADYWSIELNSVLDVGAGLGWWRDALTSERPTIAYRGVDLSPIACRDAGHEQRDIAKWRARETFDLIVCQGVLQYLGTRDCSRAIENIAAMSAGLLYLEVLTKEDIEEVVDLQKSDANVQVRTGEWYLSKLKPHFIQLGCGLFCARRSGAVFFELERILSPLFHSNDWRCRGLIALLCFAVNRATRQHTRMRTQAFSER